MQHDPLLEQLDWFFTSVNWTFDYPNTMVLPMVKITSDHIPCRISIGTNIPKSSIFRFENYWPMHQGFSNAVKQGWEREVRNKRDSTSSLAGKLKSKNLSNLSMLITNCNKVIFYLDALEECRPLFNPEWNVRNIVKVHLQTLLKYKNIYWKKRYTVNRIKFRDECTKFFHSMVTVSYRKNTITQLKNDSDV